MGTTSPNGDPYSEITALEDHQDDAESARITIRPDDIEGPFTPVIAISIRTASDEKGVRDMIKEPEPGVWELRRVGEVEEDEGDA